MMRNTIIPSQINNSFFVNFDDRPTIKAKGRENAALVCIVIAAKVTSVAGIIFLSCQKVKHRINKDIAIPFLIDDNTKYISRLPARNNIVIAKARLLGGTFL